MDVVTTRIAIIILGVTCILGIVGSIWLAAIDIRTPEILVAVISGCSTGICGILVKTKDHPEHREPDFHKNPPLP